jgi:serine/threonine protein kinase
MAPNGQAPWKEAAFEAEYTFTNEVLGSGFSGQVRLARHKQSGESVAVKSYREAKLSPLQQKDLDSEIATQSSADHPYVARLHGVYKTAEDLLLVMEHLEGGEVLDYLLKTECGLPEAHVRRVMQQLLSAVRHLHGRGMVHRDIKPENLIYTDASKETIKLIDFGFCTHWKRGDRPMTRRCGTNGYMAPEMVKKLGCTNKVDLWSVGVAAHVLLTGDMIGRSSDFRPLFSERLRRNSAEAQAFVAALLAVNPEDRLSAAQAQRHSWVQNQKASSEVSEEVNSGYETSCSLSETRTTRSSYGSCSTASSAESSMHSVSKWREDMPAAGPASSPQAGGLREGQARGAHHDKLHRELRQAAGLKPKLHGPAPQPEPADGHGAAAEHPGGLQDMPAAGPASSPQAGGLREGQARGAHHDKLHRELRQAAGLKPKLHGPAPQPEPADGHGAAAEHPGGLQDMPAAGPASSPQDQTAKAKKSLWELLPRVRVSRRVSAAFAAVRSMRQGGRTRSSVEI